MSSVRQQVAKPQVLMRSQQNIRCHLIKIVNDTLLSIDSGSVVGLVGLDVTAAFDTVSHDQLVDRLKSEFGIDSAPLQWIESYLKSRVSQFSLDGHCPQSHP